MNKYLQLLASYNLWANERICGLLEKAGEAAINFEQKSSFPTVKKTFLHICGAQQVWLERLRGKSPGKIALEEKEALDFEGLRQYLMGTSEEIINYVGNIKNSEEIVYYTAWDGKTYSSSVEQIIMHCINHSTFHRGQIVTMLRGAGFTDLVSTDMIRFFREVHTFHS